MKQSKTNRINAGTLSPPDLGENGTDDYSKQHSIRKINRFVYNNTNINMIIILYVCYNERVFDAGGGISQALCLFPVKAL